ncbi:MAG: uroporphyrinogen decarboxylase family protein [Anaerolineae bacterium]
MNELERFLACMEYQPADRRPNHELGVWPQTVARWQQEAPRAIEGMDWNWFYAEPSIALDRRDYIPMNYGMIPHFDYQVLEETDEYEVLRDTNGILRKALKEGTLAGGRMSMDQYLEFPIKTPADAPDIVRRLNPFAPGRQPADLAERVPVWKQRDYPLILGRNCDANGFYWRARELLGTENLSLAWYDYPGMMHELMEVYAQLIIEASRPVLEQINVEYFVFNEDLSMKAGPLLSPKTYREFIFPRLRRVIDFLKSHGVRYVALDTDGNPTVLVSTFMDAGVDVLWPLERASDNDPVQIRRQFGKSLRLWGGVDKRVIAQGRAAINAHLLALAPLIDEGGYIPTVDHTVPPDISWDNFRYYIDAKLNLLAGDYHKLG